ncbi:hypothetical protein [Streptomyces sp. NPDC054863]
MPTPRAAQRNIARTALDEAQHAVDVLAQSLAAAQITLPSLQVDLPGATSGHPMVDLGRLRADEAVRLAQALRHGGASA